MWHCFRKRSWDNSGQGKPGGLKKNSPLFCERLFCTGTLIGSQYVLTAAHCMLDQKRKPTVHPFYDHIYVHAGSIHRDQSRQSRRMANYTCHPDVYSIFSINVTHSQISVQNDICILKVSFSHFLQMDLFRVQVYTSCQQNSPCTLLCKSSQMWAIW